jgi:hypothetical protein
MIEYLLGFLVTPNVSDNNFSAEGSQYLFRSRDGVYFECEMKEENGGI